MSAAAEIQPMFFNKDGGADLDIQFEAGHFSAVTPYSEDLDDEYQAAQDRLRELREQEELVRRQAAELEELTRREKEFKEGRGAVTEELGNLLDTLDREATECQRRAESCGEAHERLESHLAHVNALRPEAWSRADRKSELSRSIACIEAAREEIARIRPLLSERPKAGLLAGLAPSILRRGAPGNGGADFLYWFKSGFAFSLPMVGFGVVALLVVLFL